MSLNFRDKAIAAVKSAIDADEAHEYQKALNLYKSALDMWLVAVKWEKNPGLKEMMRGKMAEYLNRAEQIKRHLAEDQEKATENNNGHSKKAAASSDDSKKMQNTLSDAILHEKPNVRWEDVAGLEAAKESLKLTVILPVKFPSLFQDNLRPWKAILLYGPPGTGKSYLAKAVATEANSTFFSVSSSDLVSKWMGDSEKLVKVLFSMARENAPSVIFIDEIDALCGQRGDGESEAARRIKTEMLVQMDGVGHDNKGILVLGTTNLPWQLDSAMRRRFQKRVHIGLPDPNARATMFKLAIGKAKTTLQEKDFRTLAAKSEGFSGSDISTTVQTALMRPLQKVMGATHFKPVMKDGKQMLTPCSPGDPEGREATYDDVGPDELLAPDVTLKDFELALAESRPSVSPDDIAKQADWTAMYGSEGS